MKMFKLWKPRPDPLAEVLSLIAIRLGQIEETAKEALGDFRAYVEAREKHDREQDRKVKRDGKSY